MSNDKKVHIPTVLIGILAATIFSAGGVVVLGKVTTKQVEKHDEKIEANEADIVDHGGRIIKLETAFDYVQKSVDEIKITQTCILDEVRKIAK